MKVPNPEQTASIFSFAFYFFLDHLIFLAYRQSKVEEDQLYPLCDTDTSVHLKKRSFKVETRLSYRCDILKNMIFVSVSGQILGKQIPTPHLLRADARLPCGIHDPGGSHSCARYRYFFRVRVPATPNSLRYLTSRADRLLCNSCFSMGLLLASNSFISSDVGTA